jgi:hypothetical protein
MEVPLEILEPGSSSGVQTRYIVHVGNHPQYEHHKRVELVVEGIALTLKMFERVRQTEHVSRLPSNASSIAAGAT